MSKNLTEIEAAALDKLFTVNLAIAPGERVLVFTDYPRKAEALDAVWQARRSGIQQVAADVAAHGKKYCEVLFHSYAENGRHGIEPPKPVWEKAFGGLLVEKLESLGLFSKILEKNLTEQEINEVRSLVATEAAAAVNVVVGLAWYSTSHTFFRKLLTEICGCRYASMPEFEREMLTGAMAVDYPEMAKRTRNIAAAVEAADYVKITAPNGTDLTLTIGGRKAWCDVGLLTKGGFSNLPAGEVFLAPIEGKSEGKLVFEIAASRRLPSPLTVIIKDGNAEKIKGAGPYRKYLEDLFASNSLTSNLAELGIGTNKGAKNPLNILEAEKIWGTIHIALGDNSGFGGTVSVPFHQDYVVYNPTMTLYKKGKKPDTILENGTWLNY